MAFACTEPESYPYTTGSGGSGARAARWDGSCPGVAGRTSRALIELEALDNVDGARAAAADAGDVDGGDMPPRAADAELATPVPACQGGRVLHFVYFVEADQVFKESQRAALERQALVTQQYFYDLLGATFYLSYPIVEVIRGQHSATWYTNTPDGIHDDHRFYRLGNMKNEVYAALGFEDFDPYHRVVNYPVARRDGRVAANFGGAWMDGDDLSCIVDGGYSFEFDCTPGHCLGGMLHELGHVLGLEHTGPEDDCMVQGLYVDDLDDLCTFSDSNVARILGNRDNRGWFEAAPGELCVGAE